MKVFSVAIKPYFESIMRGFVKYTLGIINYGSVDKFPVFKREANICLITSG